MSENNSECRDLALIPRPIGVKELLVVQISPSEIQTAIAEYLTKWYTHPILDITFHVSDTDFGSELHYARVEYIGCAK